MSSPHFERCASVGRFGVTLLLCGFATGCDKTHWYGCARQSVSDVATLLASGIAAGILPNALQQLREEKACGAESEATKEPAGRQLRA